MALETNHCCDEAVRSGAHVMRSHCQDTEGRSYRLRFGYRFTVVVAAISLGTLVMLVVAEFSGQKPLSAQEKTFLEKYEIIRSKLAHDELVGARHESSVLARSFSSHIGKAAQAIADSEGLEQARLGFVTLSQQAIPMARNRKGYYVMYCPPVGCPQGCEECPMWRFGEWVQVNRAVENPFTGGDQTHCGVVRE